MKFFIAAHPGRGKDRSQVSTKESGHIAGSWNVHSECPNDRAKLASSSHWMKLGGSQHYIEMFYNPKGKHVRNCMLSPIDFERQGKLSRQGV